MPCDDEAGGSREGLLHAHSQDTYTLDSLRKSSDSSDSDIDATDFLPASDITPAYDSYTRLAALRRTFHRRSKCLLITLGVLIILWSILAGGGFFIYKKAPNDGQSPPWYPSPRGGTVGTWKDSYAKAAKLVEQMTLPEKVNVTTGTGWMMGLAVGQTGAVERLGFPSLALQDGPLGLRFADNATAFPAGLTIGATWNKELMYRRGQAHGKEAREKGVNVLLGPCVGPLGRMPAGGRNWEGFASDPYLQGIAAARTIMGIQGEGVVATIKHFIGNEQEHFRQSFEWGLPNAMSSNMDDRTLHEVYLWPFADAVKAGVGSVCSCSRTTRFRLLTI